MNVRTFKPIATTRSKELIPQLFDDRTEPTTYKHNMEELGAVLATAVATRLNQNLSQLRVAMSAEDADFLAKTFIEKLESLLPSTEISVACFWNEPSVDLFEIEEFDMSRVIKSYIEPVTDSNCPIIILKSVISGACVVATNLTALITNQNPSRIYIVAPVMLSTSPKNLRRHFPASIFSKFEYITLAMDSEKQSGKSVYQHYGWENAAEKNKCVPKLIEERRSKRARQRL